MGSERQEAMRTLVDEFVVKVRKIVGDSNDMTSLDKAGDLVADCMHLGLMADTYDKQVDNQLKWKPQDEELEDGEEWKRR